MKNLSTKIFILVLFFIISFLNTDSVYAAQVKLDFSNKIVGAGEQFYVDLMLNTEGESVNTIEGDITFQNDNISFVRYEEGKSMVNLWIKKPTLDFDGNTLSFAGVMTNGFSGVIDPFNPSKRLPGLIIRLVFEGKKPGLANFSTSTFNLNLNDGEGTSITATPYYGSVNIGNFVNNQKYNNKSNAIPTLDAYVIRDPDVYNNKYILIFRAVDKGTGIKDIKIKEGRRDWVANENSPYLLKDQSRRSIIYIQATNNEGITVIKTIEPIPHDFSLSFYIVIILFVILVTVVGVIIYKRKIKKQI